jgi:alpha-1,6-mannosyltransferase
VSSLSSAVAPARVGASSRARTLAGTGALATLLIAGFIMAAGGAARRVLFFVPAALNGFPDWLAGPLHGLHLVLTPADASVLLLVMSAGYVAAVLCAGALPVRAALGVVVALHVVFLVAPPLYSADVFGYVSFARLGAVHELSPYVHNALSAPSDPSIPWIRWHHIHTPYGPVFTLASYVVAPMSVAAALWTLKATAALTSLACVALTWKAAARRGVDPLPAALFVGLNPLLLAYGVGGAHNDLLLMTFALVGVLFALTPGKRAATGAGGSLILAAAVKASALVVLPFALIGTRERRRFLVGAVAATATVVVVSSVAFGGHALGFIGSVEQQQHFVASYSLPNRVGIWLGFGHITGGIRYTFLVGAAVSFVWLLWRTWRGMDWIAAAGWATLALLCASAWLVPWYVVWALPLAAISGDRRLKLGALAFSAFVVVGRVGYYLF